MYRLQANIADLVKGLKKLVRRIVQKLMCSALVAGLSACCIEAFLVDYFQERMIIAALSAWVLYQSTQHVRPHVATS